MIDGHPHGGTLLLRQDRCRPVPVPGPRLGTSADDGPRVRAVGSSPAAPTGRFRSPALVLLAATVIYLGYCELGVIATTGATWAWLVAARPAVGAEGILVLATTLALTRPAAGYRLPGRRAVLTGAGVVAVLSVLAALTAGRLALTALGAADLALAAVTLGAVLALERGRHTTAGPSTTGRVPTR